MKQTVYIKSKSTDKALNTFALTKISDKSLVEFVTKQEGFFFTEEQLKQLLSDTFDEGGKSNNDWGEYAPEFQKEKKEYIKNFLNKEL